jgi:hypothetical protein
MTEAAQTNLIIGGTVFILLFGLFSNYLLQDYAPAETVQGSWACTADIQVCSDGSTVSRVPPYCKFQACPR